MTAEGESGRPIGRCGTRVEPRANEMPPGMGRWGMAPRRHSKTDSGMVERTLNLQMKGTDRWPTYQDVGGSSR
jgi:hypothetical protein